MTEVKLPRDLADRMLEKSVELVVSEYLRKLESKSQPANEPRT